MGKVVARKTILVMFACNDYRSGNPANELFGIHFGDAMTIERYIVDAKTSFWDGGGEVVHIGRRKFPCRSYRNWIGNWCWDGAQFTLQVAADLANYVKSLRIGDTQKFCIESGADGLFDKWKSDELFIASDFK